jgi:hypothetical protein
MHKGGIYMHFQKFEKLPPAQEDLPAYNKKRRQLYLDGHDYFFGRNGKEKNAEKSYQLIKQSADMNFSYALNAIGSFYNKGLIVPQDYQKALTIYQEMYERLNPIATYNLGLAYKKGYGVPVDVEMAKKYFVKSIVFAIREILRGEELGRRLFEEVFSVLEQKLDEYIAIYLKAPLCEFCHGIVPQENKRELFKDPHILREVEGGLLEAIENNQFGRCEPVLKNGYCCYNCEQHYVEPIRKALANGSISQEEVDLLEHRDDLIAALEKILKTN